MARDLDVPRRTCKWHRCRRGYLEWHGWAEAQTKAGKKQRKCADCGRWFFKEEWGTGPRGRSWRLASC